MSRISPARKAAFSALYAVYYKKAFASVALDQTLKQRGVTGRDAGLATHIVYGTLRHDLSLEQHLAPFLQPHTPHKARLILKMGTFEKFYLGTPDHAVVSEYVDLAKSEIHPLAKLVNAVLRRVQPIEPSFALPDWLEKHFDQTFAKDAPAVKASLLEPTPLWLWCSEKGLEGLREEGVVLNEQYAPIVQVVFGYTLSEHPLYKTGHIQPINPASYQVILAMGDVQNTRVLDLAGGNGIKASLLALGGASVTSIDIHAKKHDAARRNMHRLGVSANFISADLTQPLDIPPAKKVLLDAPCSGTGTLRSHPEIKLRLSPEAIEELGTLQDTLIQNAAQMVCPGGTLVFSVCSITHREGDAVIENFLKTHANFQIDMPECLLPHRKTPFGLYTLPTEGIDGFYIARLKRNPS